MKTITQVHPTAIFDQQLANHLARLAKLDPDHPALSNCVADMRRILDMVGIMDQADTDGVEPLRHPLELPGWQREDKAESYQQRDQLLTCAPAVSDGLFLVPRVIDQ